MDPQLTDLYGLAEYTVGELLPFSFAEGRMLDAAAAGEVIALDGAHLPPEAWGNEHDVRPELLRWLCSDPVALARVHEHGLHLKGVRVTGPLNLSAIHMPYPLIFENCVLDHGFGLVDSELGGLAVLGTRMGPMRGDRLALHGPLTVGGGTRITGGLRLKEATVAGALSLTHADLLNRGGVAFGGSGLSVEGDLRLGQGFRALGTVRLVGAVVAGHLDLNGARLLNRGGVALACDRLAVAGDLYLHGNFRAYGQVRLVQAHVSGAIHGDEPHADTRLPGAG